MKKDHVAWCRTLFDKLSDDGLWGLPRSGMVFRKNAETKTLVWVATFPGEVKVKHPSLAREGELLTQMKYFGKAGITIAVSRPVLDYGSFEEAEADQKNKVMVGVPVQ